MCLSRQCQFRTSSMASDDSLSCRVIPSRPLTVVRTLGTQRHTGLCLDVEYEGSEPPFIAALSNLQRRNAIAATTSWMLAAIVCNLPVLLNCRRWRSGQWCGCLLHSPISWWRSLLWCWRRTNTHILHQVMKRRFHKV